MALARLIDEKALSNHIFSELNREVLAAAEPLVERAVREFEASFRKKLAERVLSLIQSNYAVERMGTDIRIIVKGFTND